MMLNYAYHGNLTYTTFTRSPHDSVRSYLESADDEGQALAVVGLCKAQVARCKSSLENRILILRPPKLCTKAPKPGLTSLDTPGIPKPLNPKALTVNP